MGYMINLKRLGELMRHLESSDASTVKEALVAVRNIQHNETRLELLAHAARHCGSPELATEAFTELCEELETFTTFTGEEKAGLVEDIIRYGSKVSAIRLLAMEYIVGLVERKELERNSEAVQDMLRFIVEVVRDKESEIVRKAKTLMVEDR